MLPKQVTHRNSENVLFTCPTCAIAPVEDSASVRRTSCSSLPAGGPGQSSGHLSTSPDTAPWLYRDQQAIAFDSTLRVYLLMHNSAVWVTNFKNTTPLNKATHQTQVSVSCLFYIRSSRNCTLAIACSSYHCQPLPFCFSLQMRKSLGKIATPFLFDSGDNSIVP